jgi:uncharacterized SAM-binding protein YcdF (DUF218 family)
VYLLVSELARPAVLLSLVAGLALANLWRKRRESRRRLLPLTVALLLLALGCSPAASHLALGSLEWPYPPLAQRPDDVEAIVVLAGYVCTLDDAGEQVELDTDTLYRCLRAAEVYRAGKPCPVFLSGGKPNPDEAGPAFAVSMRDFLLRMGLPAGDLVVEDRSRTTYENAVETCRLLEERGLHKVLLVTDASSLYRATACFRKQGADVVPCGCRYRAGGMSWSVGMFLPEGRAAVRVQEAWHEWLGSAWYRLTGKM